MRLFALTILLLLLPGLFAQNKILIIVSSETVFPLKEGKSYDTGYYFNELTVPAMALGKAGYELVVATPGGKTPAMDKRSDTVSYFPNEAAYEEAKKFHDGIKGLKKPLALSDVISGGLGDYAGVFFPGGHAPMTDLARSSEVGQILQHFHKNSKPTALICHGPIALIGASADPVNFLATLEAGKKEEAKQYVQNWPYRGYKMTIFSDDEEKVAEESILKGQVTFYPQKALEAAGGNVLVGKMWGSNAVRDRELITGQNPASDRKFVELFIQALQEKAAVKKK